MIARCNVTRLGAYALRVHDRRGPAHDTILYQRPSDGTWYRVRWPAAQRFVPGQGWITCPLADLEA